MKVTSLPDNSYFWEECEAHLDKLHVADYILYIMLCENPVWMIASVWKIKNFKEFMKSCYTDKPRNPVRAPLFKI